MRDTLMYVKKLEAVGIPRKQAEAQVQIMTEVVDMDFATKQDLKDETTSLREEIKTLGIELRAEMKELGTELRGEIKDVRNDMIIMEHRLIIRMGRMLVASTGLTITIVGLMIKFLK